jgi:hypothetical protein
MQEQVGTAVEPVQVQVVERVVPVREREREPVQEPVQEWAQMVSGSQALPTLQAFLLSPLPSVVC